MSQLSQKTIEWLDQIQGPLPAPGTAKVNELLFNPALKEVDQEKYSQYWNSLPYERKAQPPTPRFAQFSEPLPRLSPPRPYASASSWKPQQINNYAPQSSLSSMSRNQYPRTSQQLFQRASSIPNENRQSSIPTLAGVDDDTFSTTKSVQQYLRPQLAFEKSIHAKPRTDDASPFLVLNNENTGCIKTLLSMTWKYMDEDEPDDVRAMGLQTRLNRVGQQMKLWGRDKTIKTREYAQKKARHQQMAAQGLLYEKERLDLIEGCARIWSARSKKLVEDIYKKDSMVERETPLGSRLAVDHDARKDLLQGLGRYMSNSRRLRYVRTPPSDTVLKWQKNRLEKKVARRQQK